MTTASPELPKSPPRATELICDDGEPMESLRHVRQMMLLIESLSHAWRERDDFFVGGNMFLYFSETQARRNDFRGPDVFVVMGTERRERRAWVVWEEGGKTPDVVIELLSDTTESVDRGEKMRIYARALKVAEYFLFDPFGGTLEGFELDLSGHYRPKSRNASGRLESKMLGLELGTLPGRYGEIEADWLRWFERDGRPLALPSEHAELEARRADDEKKRADDEKARADDEKARADQEQARADALAARLAAYERERSG